MTVEGGYEVRGVFSSNGEGEGGEGEAERLSRRGTNDKKGLGGVEQQCPGSKQWRQARWLQGTQHPAKYGQQHPALAYFLPT